MGHFFLDCVNSGTSRFPSLQATAEQGQEWVWLTPEGAPPQQPSDTTQAPFPVSYRQLTAKDSGGFLSTLPLLGRLFAPFSPDQTNKLSEFFTTHRPRRLVIQTQNFPPNAAVSKVIEIASFTGHTKVILEVLDLQGRPKAQKAFELDQSLTKWLTALVVPSEYMRKQLIKLRGLDPEKVQMIPPDLGEDKLLAELEQTDTEATKESSLLAVKLQDPKGVVALVEGLKRLSGQTAPQKLRLYLIGEPELLTQCNRALQTAALELEQPFAGTSQPQEKIISGAQLLVFAGKAPSFYDITACYGLLFGVPMISGKQGAVGELVIHQVTGLQIDPSDPAAYQQAVELLLADKQTRTGMSLSAKERFFRLYARKKSAELFEKLWV